MEAAINWTFASECAVTSDIERTLVPGEQVYAAYKTVRDIAAITNKRIIVRDSQGLTGKKVEIYSLPWSAVNMWSSENSGALDFNSEMEFWTKAGHIKLNLKKGIDIRKLDQLISTFVLG